MTIHEAEIALDGAFPTSTWAVTVRGITEGVFLAADAMENTPFLKNLLGRDIKGQLRRVGVMFRLQELCKAGDLPFQAEIERMPRGSWHWLEIKSGKINAHVVRSEAPGEFPEETPNRQDRRLVNQGELDLEGNGSGRIIPISAFMPDIQSWYAWLLFGVTKKNELTHAAWAIPDADAAEWMAYKDILNGAKGQMPTPAATSPDPLSKMKFKQHIEEALDRSENETDKDTKK